MTQLSISRPVRLPLWFVLIWGVMVAGVHADTGTDVYLRQSGSNWTFGSSAVERTVALEDGRLLLKSLKDKRSGRELVDDGASPEFFFRLGDDGPLVTGATGPWTLIRAQHKRLSQGELQFELTVGRPSLEVTKTYVIYPGSSVVRQWVTIKNVGQQPTTILEPGFLNLVTKADDLARVDLLWMSGGNNQPGSWKLKTESLDPAAPRVFDSYDPFPYEETQEAAETFPGDGINAAVRLNDQQVWPSSGWQYVPNSTVEAPLDLTLDVKPGDRLVFLVNRNRGIGYDTTAFDPTIAYEDGESHTASKEFGEKQGERGWRYQYLENGRYVDLVYYASCGQWRKQKDNATGTPFVGRDDQHPDQGQDAARVWTVPKAGKVRIRASICNTGNGRRKNENDLKVHRRAGTSSYAPWAAIYGNRTRQGVFFGWDYFGHWATSFAANPEGAVAVRLKVAGYKNDLAAGQQVTTPKALVGLYQDDLDNAGNELLDWQYAYLWDYTREPWFPAIRMLGYWYQGTSWRDPSTGWRGGKPDFGSTFRKVFRVADLMRYCGADVYHRDWGWWDRAGDWNGPDFRATGDYLRKSGMGQLIYAFLYTVDPECRFVKETGGRYGNGTLDMARPEVVEHIKHQLDTFYKLWGPFEWRNDSGFLTGTDANLVDVDTGFRRVIREFLDAHPDCAFQAVNGGGNFGGYDYTRYASSFSFSDGAVGILRNYYAALLFPPDKTSDIPDRWNPNAYAKATWRGLLCINFDMTGDTWDPEKLEGVRELIDVYHYLHRQGVVGRWVKVYRPRITGDDPTMYFQRLSRDRLRGIIIPKRPALDSVTIKPKGLLADAGYFVSFHESPATENRTGADLMEHGIVLDKMLPGELIYLNLPLHPGSKRDKEPPTAPPSAGKQTAENMGYPGVELTWEPGTDNNWISYYEVFRNGVAIDKVAKGTFYFDHSAGADPAATYEVRTVDGAENVSGKVAATGPEAPPARVVDDAPGEGLVYRGEWKRQTGLQPAHADTISLSDRKGATAELSFEGEKVLLFAKMGADCGKATVSIDGGAPEVVDTYSADDIWGVCVYRKHLVPGPHRIRIEVIAERCDLASGALVHVDGVRVERK